MGRPGSFTASKSRATQGIRDGPALLMSASCRLAFIPNERPCSSTPTLLPTPGPLTSYGSQTALVACTSTGEPVSDTSPTTTPSHGKFAVSARRDSGALSIVGCQVVSACSVVYLLHICQERLAKFYTFYENTWPTVFQGLNLDPLRGSTTTARN